MTLKSRIKKTLNEALGGKNFVISPSWRSELEPTARCYWDEDKSLNISIGKPPGNAYSPVDGEFFVTLGCIESDSLEWHIKGDGDEDYCEDDKWDSEEEMTEQVSYEYVQAMMSEWVREIECEIDALEEDAAPVDVEDLIALDAKNRMTLTD